MWSFDGQFHMNSSGHQAFDVSLVQQAHKVRKDQSRASARDPQESQLFNILTDAPQVYQSTYTALGLLANNLDAVQQILEPNGCRYVRRWKRQ